MIYFCFNKLLLSMGLVVPLNLPLMEVTTLAPTLLSVVTAHRRGTKMLVWSSQCKHSMIGALTGCRRAGDLILSCHIYRGWFQRAQHHLRPLRFALFDCLIIRLTLKSLWSNQAVTEKGIAMLIFIIITPTSYSSSNSPYVIPSIKRPIHPPYKGIRNHGYM